MYLVYCLSIWLFVYTLPVLAFYPKLLLSPKTVFAIPILSALIIYALTSVLQMGELFNREMVWCSVIALAGVAAFRVHYTSKRSPHEWTRAHFKWVGFHGLLMLPYATKLGTHAFERGDEIYSWNFWAIQHYFSLPLDFSHTGAPYPQLFPKLLAFSYHLLGDLNLQLPVRATLIIFPFALVTAVGMACRLRQNAVIMYLILLIVVLAGIGLAQFFNDAYADPIMTSALVVSFALLWQSKQRPASSSATTLFSSHELAFFAVLSAILAAHTKQPALLWAMVSLPLLLWKKPSLAFLSFAGGLSWLLCGGQDFHHNHGVLTLSFEGRTWASQLLFSANKYLFQQPLIFLLFGLAIVRCKGQRLLTHTFLLFIVPSLVCWFLFGAYQLRLGQHLIALLWFMVVASQLEWPESFFIKRPSMKASAVLGMVVSVTASTYLYVQVVYFQKGGLSLYAGDRYRLERYFQGDSDTVHALVNPDVTLWVPSRYLYGLFYPNAHLASPQYHPSQPYSTASLIHELQEKKPDYVFLANRSVADGPASDCLAHLIAQCPASFEKIVQTKNKFGFMTYRFDAAQFLNDPCVTQHQAPAPNVAFNR